jgi:radical SAM protein with 4Fe4S-binding SPASM domain
MGLVASPRRWTPRRLANVARAAWQHFVTQPDVSRAKPVRLVIDPSSHCHLRCPLCPTGQGRNERTRATLSLAHFQRLIDEVSDTLLEVDLFGWGEPLMNPALEGMIAYANTAGIRTVVSTHLNLLNEQRAAALCDAGLDELIVSLDGASADTYGRYRVGGDFGAVLRNVALLRRVRGARKTPTLTWKMLVMQHNEHEVPLAKARWKALGFDALVLKAVRTDMGRELEWSDKKSIEVVRPWLPKTSDIVRYDETAERRHHAPSRCLFLWTQAVVDPRGSVAPCCAVYEPAHDLGQTNDGTSLMSVWNGERAQALRKQVRTRDATRDSPCSRCIKEGFVEY